MKAQQNFLITSFVLGAIIGGLISAQFHLLFKVSPLDELCTSRLIGSDENEVRALLNKHQGKVLERKRSGSETLATDFAAITVPGRERNSQVVIEVGFASGLVSDVSCTRFFDGV